MELRDYLLLARRQWHLIVAGGLVAVAGALGLTMLTTPQYSATIKVFVSSAASHDSSTFFQSGAYAEQRAKSYASLLQSRRLAAAVIRDLGLRTSPEELRSHVSTSVIPGTVVLRATVTDPSPRRAQAVANALGHELDALVTQLESTGKTGPPPVRVTTVDTADLPRTPASPRLADNLLSALAVGLLLGAGLAVLRDHLDRTVKTSEQLKELTGAPTLGVIIADPHSAERPLVIHAEPHAHRSEDFRQLRTSLQFINVARNTQRIVVTSCRPGEGKSCTVSNLAITIAQAGQRVIVVDADLRQPRLSDYLGIEGAAGLTDVLIGRADLDDVLQPWGGLPMWALPSGQVPPNPSELLGSAAMTALIEQLDTRADVILFDVPPLLPVTDAVVLARACDGVILIARHGWTDHDQLRRAVLRLNDVDVPVLGAILNMVPAKDTDVYGDDYRYVPERLPAGAREPVTAAGGGGRPADAGTTVE